MTEPRLPTMKEMEEIVKAETLYKVAHVEDEKAGKFSSCYIGQPCALGWNSHLQLKYAIGKVTIALDDSEGINCYPLESLTYAQDHATNKTTFIIQPPCVVLEVKPLGGRSISGYPMSVYVVGVYGKKGEYVNPFKVGDRVKVKESVGRPKYGWGIGGSVTHSDIGVVKEVSGTNLEVLFPRFCDGNVTWLAHAPEMELVPEPKEEWVDVTRECTLKFLHASCCEGGGEYIELCHEGVSVVCFGLGGHWQSLYLAGGYKIDPVRRNYLGNVGTFRILKKELK